MILSGLPPSTDDKTRHLTMQVGHVGMGRFALAAPSDGRRTPVNRADWVFSSDTPGRSIVRKALDTG
jgi:hypothetical protein